MAGINRAHDAVLQKMLRAGVDVRAGVDQNEHVELRRQYRRDAGPVDSLKCPQFDYARGDCCAGVAGAHHCVHIPMFYEIDSATD